MFDLSQVPVSDYSPVPKGIYPAHVENAEFKESKAGSEYLSIMWQIHGSKHEGRKVFSNLNILHPTEQVKNIALGQLKSMLKAGGSEVLSFKSKEELVNIVRDVRCLIKLDVKDEQNVIKGYEAAGEIAAPTVSTDDLPF